MHRDSIDRFEVQTIPTAVGHKRLGSYLIEAGLINEAQVAVALNDQQATGMKFGEVLATRGWIKQQTVEYLMQKVILPERRARERKKKQHGAPHHGNPMARTTRPPSAKVSTVKAVPNQNKRPPQPSQAEFSTLSQSPDKPKSSPSDNDSSFTRRDAPITKPLPPVSNGDGDVSWVG